MEIIILLSQKLYMSAKEILVKKAILYKLYSGYSTLSVKSTRAKMGCHYTHIVWKII